MGPADVALSRARVEDFLFEEAALLDAWRLDDWLALLTPDAVYRIPSNDAPGTDPHQALYTIADDIHRIRARVTRLKDRNAHAEFPPSRTRRMISNVRLLSSKGNEVHVEANFIVVRFRRNEDERQYVGRYRYLLRIENQQPRIAMREAILDRQELGSLGTISFIL
jgi:p-cumate 2,3-dioxygenase subunit beta